MVDLTYLHPMVVHFPIALIIVAFLFELGGTILKRESFASGAFWLLLLGTAALIVTYFSGRSAGGEIAESGMLKAALEAHEDAATLTLMLILAAFSFRLALMATRRFRRGYRWSFIALLFVGVLSIARTGSYGGDLVYKHAAGVNLQIGIEELPSNAPPPSYLD